MYILIPTASPEPYRQLKSLSFAPEVDLTLSSLPVNEFRAEIVTEDVIPAGVEAILMDDMDQLWADYTITKAERIDRQSFRIVAQSDLTLMDRWTLPAEMFQNVEVSRFIQWLFRIPKSGYLYNVDIDVDVYFNGVTVTGFCPEQTARERLQWLCVTVGAVVRQCFASALQFIPAPDVDATAYYAKGTLIPISETFMKPSVTIRELMRSVAVTGYENFTNVDPTPQPEAGMEPGEEPAEAVEWESSVDEQGVTWWYIPVDWTFENEAAPEIPGQGVDIDGITLISGSSARQVLGWLAAAYFRQGNITIECINNRQYYPGQKVRVYTDENTIYDGYIQSCDFTFGVQAKSRLVISSDLYQVPMGTMIFYYRCNGQPIGVKVVNYPADEPYSIDFPDVEYFEGNTKVRYTPITPNKTGVTPGGRTEYEIEYYEEEGKKVPRYAMAFRFPDDVISKYSPEPANQYGVYLKMSRELTAKIYRVAFYLVQGSEAEIKRAAFASVDGFTGVSEGIVYVPYVGKNWEIIEDGITHPDINTFTLYSVTTEGKTYYRTSLINANLEDANGNPLTEYTIDAVLKSGVAIFYNESEAINYVMGGPEPDTTRMLMSAAPKLTKGGAVNEQSEGLDDGNPS